MRDSRGGASQLKRPRSSQVSLVDEDILMGDMSTNGLEELRARDESRRGNYSEKNVLTLRPCKRTRLTETRAQPSLTHNLIDCNDENCDNEESNDKIKQTVIPVHNEDVLSGRRKRTLPGNLKRMGYLDVFSKVNPSNSSPEQRISTQWKMLDDRVNRTLRNFRGYHREHFDFEYEV